MPEPLARRFSRQLVDAVSYCHAHGVYHRNLKPETCSWPLMVTSRLQISVSVQWRITAGPCLRPAAGLPTIALRKYGTVPRNLNMVKKPIPSLSVLFYTPFYLSVSPFMILMKSNCLKRWIDARYIILNACHQTQLTCYKSCWCVIRRSDGIEWRESYERGNFGGHTKSGVSKQDDQRKFHRTGKGAWYMWSTIFYSYVHMWPSTRVAYLPSARQIQIIYVDKCRMYQHQRH